MLDSSVDGEPELQCKLVTLGESNVGKTSLVQRFIHNKFAGNSPPTVGASFCIGTIPTKKCAVRLEIWDTAGQERFRSLAPMYYRGASAAVICYSVNNEESFGAAQRWVDELHQKGQEDVLVAIVANKCDLPDEDRMIDIETGRKYAQSIDALFMETSAKSGHNVAELFAQLGERLAADAEERGSFGTPDVVDITSTKGGKDDGKGCCGG